MHRTKLMLGVLMLLSISLINVFGESLSDSSSAKKLLTFSSAGLMTDNIIEVSDESGEIKVVAEGTQGDSDRSNRLLEELKTTLSGVIVDNSLMNIGRVDFASDNSMAVFSAAKKLPDWVEDSEGVSLGVARTILMYIYFFGSNKLEQIGPVNGKAINPSFSPDGKLIAFYYNPDTLTFMDDRYYIYKISSDGDGLMEIAPRSQTEDFELAKTRTYCPKWSQDGKKVFFQAKYNNKLSNWVVPVTGGNPQDIQVGGGMGHFNVSKDGEIVCGERWTGEIMEIHCWNGTGLSKLGNGYLPQISSDGKYISFLSKDKFSLFVADRESKEVKRVAQDTVPIESVKWLH